MDLGTKPPPKLGAFDLIFLSESVKTVQGVETVESVEGVEHVESVEMLESVTSLKSIKKVWRVLRALIVFESFQLVAMNPYSLGWGPVGIFKQNDFCCLHL